MLSVLLQTALALDCAGLEADSCAAANLLADQINAELGAGTIDDAHARVQQRTLHLYNKIEAVRAHAAANSCQSGEVTLVGAQGGPYDSGAPKSFGGLWAHLDGSDEGVVTDGFIDTATKTFWGDHTSSITGTEGSVGAAFSSYNAQRQVVGSRDGGFLAGTWVRLGGMRGFYATVYGDCAGDPREIFEPWFDGELPSGVPTLQIPATLLELQPGDAEPIATGALVTDNRDVVTSGQLVISLSGPAADSTLSVPASPVVGTIAGNGTSTVTLTLVDASLDDLEAVLDGTLIRPGLTKDAGTITVQLTDADGNTAASTRDFEVQPLQLVVGPTGDFPTITQALSFIATTPGATGATVDVQPGDYSAGSRVEVDHPNHDGLTIRGAAAGVPAGVGALARPQISQVPQIVVRADDVVLDGVDIDRPAGGFGDGVDAQGQNISIQNCVVTTAGGTGSAVSVRDGSSQTTLQDNAFNGWSNGAFVQGGDGLLIDGNTFDTDTGVVFWSNPVTGTEVISNNAFTGGIALEHRFIGTATANVVLFVGNDVSDGSPAIRAANGHIVNADGNWWGQASGPLPGQVDVASGATVSTASPLAADPFPAFP